MKPIYILELDALITKYWMHMRLMVLHV